MSRYHTILTAVVANRERQDSLDVVFQAAQWEAAELAYLEMTRQQTYESIAQVMERVSELLADQRNRQAYQARTQILIDIVGQIEAEGQFPKVDYAFDAGVCTSELTQAIEAAGKHGV